MNVSLKNIDAVSAILKVEIEKNDYADQVNKNLRKLRQQAKIPGFRQGMVPLDYIKKMYGKQTMLEEVNNLVSKGVYSYITDNNVQVLGNPIPNETEPRKIDWDVDENFEFCFDIALTPEINIDLTKDDTLTSYTVLAENEVVDQQIESDRRQYGSYDKADTVIAEDLVKGKMIELEEGAPKADGIVVEDATVMPSYMKGKMEQKKFIGAKVDKIITFNPYKAFKGADAEIASLLNIDKEAVSNMKSDFSFEIKEITRYTPAALDREFFDKVLGADVVKSEEEFREKIKEMASRQYEPYIDVLLKRNIQDMLIQKADGVAFADEILKRWLLVTNEKSTIEAVENDYPKFVADLKYHLITGKLVKAYDIKVEDEDIEAMARQIVRSQLAQYGMMSVPDDMLDNYVKEMTGKQETVDKLANDALEEKLMAYIRDLITVNVQEVTTDEFMKIIDEKK